MRCARVQKVKINCYFCGGKTRWALTVARRAGEAEEDRRRQKKREKDRWRRYT